jgi:hypothetical protein
MCGLPLEQQVPEIVEVLEKRTVDAAVRAAKRAHIIERG